MTGTLDLLTDACIGLEVTTKKMFGGHGFFAPNGGMFAGIVTDDEVILKLALGPARDELVALGGRPWTYSGRGKEMTMQEWIVVPSSFYDDQELFSTWAARAHRLAPPKAPGKKAKRSPAAKKQGKAQTTSKKAKPRKPSPR